MRHKLLFVVLAILSLSACASFNDRDDDPALCENGRRPKPNGDCPTPSTSTFGDPRAWRPHGEGRDWNAAAIWRSDPTSP